ncbi:hypothetical protein ABZZ17_39250 [Streptomyces sp. NPDC006512]|uniref:hypothetical protein n=1 Tax=Streptomyces sp. NPDC006512 TaxID=3154307 RepID=UPI00339F3517
MPLRRAKVHGTHGEVIGLRSIRDHVVAKHRNGPTATIATAFRGHYPRFVDMAST